MPGFIKTPSDEARWAKAKNAVMKARKKGEKEFTDKDWGLSNSIFQKMKQSKEKK